MAKIHWTGHPFVDAGLAALAAAADVDDLEKLNSHKLRKAADELKRVLLSDQALGVGVEKAFVRSALSQIFPNSELVNPSNWKGRNQSEKVANIRRKFTASLESELLLAEKVLANNNNDFEGICFACGEKRPKSTLISLRKDKMPLLGGFVNYYPALTHGFQICGLCALSVRFFPMSVLRTGVYRRLWFIHAQSLPIAKAISSKYGWSNFNKAIASNESLDFFTNWQTAGDESTVLSVLCELLEEKELRNQLLRIYENPLPTTAYLFSNDNRTSYIKTLPIPNKILEFFALLQVKSGSEFKYFWQSLFFLPDNPDKKNYNARINFIQSVANRILNEKPLIGICIDSNNLELRGGWYGHRLYLEKVLQMSQTKLAILERLGISIANSNNVKRLVSELRAADYNKLYAIFLDYVRNGFLKHDEFYTLIPPNSISSISEIRDILLAIIYEYLRYKNLEKDFPKLEEISEICSDDLLQNIERIGEKLINRLPNVGKWVGQLQTAKNSSAIRKVYLNAIQPGAMKYKDFILLAPIDDTQQLWLLRDYLLAYLFEKVKTSITDEDSANESM